LIPIDAGITDRILFKEFNEINPALPASLVDNESNPSTLLSESPPVLIDVSSASASASIEIDIFDKELDRELV
jgi:hypothetical protein